MTLISVILALIADRLGGRSKIWQTSTYASWYAQTALPLLNVLKALPKPLALVLWLAVPALAVQWLVSLSDFALWQLASNSAVVLVCFGCAHLRRDYKGYLNALTRGDHEAATLYALQLGQKRTEDQKGGETFAETLAWINFRFYCAVIFWFVLLGAFGALFYALTRAMTDESDSADSALHAYHVALKRISHWAEWPAARVASFGYLVIGNFSKGTQVWVRYLLNFKASNRRLVAQTALAAEQIEIEHYGCAIEAQCMMRLVKRNILFFLALIAILTLFGGLS